MDIRKNALHEMRMVTQARFSESIFAGKTLMDL